METPTTYESFLLRLWRGDARGPAAWRVSLEDTRTGARHSFADLAAACDFLESRFGPAEPAPPPSRPERDR